MIFGRFLTTLNPRVKTVKSIDFLNESIKLFIIPLHKDKSFVYLKHDETLLNKKSKLIKYEKWTIEKSTSLWNKMSKSPNRLNQKIVALVKSYLDHIPWQENSLMTIPGEHYIAKRILKTTDKITPISDTPEIEQKDPNKIDTIVTKTEFEKLESKPTLKPINVYYMEDLSSLQQVKSQLEQLCEWGIKYHFRECIKCIIGLPFTIPLILIPIIPNVPGFYLLYRAYCNIKAYFGAKHLQKLIKDDLLAYKGISNGDVIPMDKSQKGNEISSEQLNVIVNKLDIVELKPVLERALNQEKRKRLKEEPTNLGKENNDRRKNES